MNRKLITLSLLLVSTTLWFVEFGYLWDLFTDQTVLLVLALSVIILWSVNASILFVLLKLFPLFLVNPPIHWAQKYRDTEESSGREWTRSRFSVAQEFTTFGICIATLLWLLRMYFSGVETY